MKYGESGFILLYLLFAIPCGIYLLRRSVGPTGKQMGLATLLLGVGDAFHLIPCVLAHFSTADLTAALGFGKLVTSLTATAFYVLMYYIWLGIYQEKKRGLTAAIWGLFALRIALCLLPQNNWMQNSSDMFWGVIRNVPFTVLGMLMMPKTVCYVLIIFVFLLFVTKDKEKTV